MNIFFILHVILFIFAIIVPFIGNSKQLEFYSLLVPFLMFHWLMNDDTCFLTTIEKHLTNKPYEQTFSGRLIGPIYNLSDDESGKFIKMILFLLWMFVQYKTGHLKTIFSKK